MEQAYNINHNSVYKRIEEDFLNSDDYSKEEVLLLCDHTYRMEILEVFRMRVFDEAEMNMHVCALYNDCKTSAELMSCAEALDKDLEVGFRLFFSYDYFYLAHKCIAEFLKNGKICEDSLNSFLFLLKANSNSIDENSTDENSPNENS
jgi:hypothetical protein